MGTEKSISSITEKTKDKEVRITIEKITNGYLLTENIDYKDKKGNWNYETNKTFYEENPIKNLKF